MPRTHPALDIADLREFGPHRLRATVLATVVEECDLPSDRVDEFVAAVDEMAHAALRRSRGAVGVRLWTGGDVATAAVFEERGLPDVPHNGVMLMGNKKAQRITVGVIIGVMVVSLALSLISSASATP
jgi:hypothetical protein